MASNRDALLGEDEPGRLRVVLSETDTVTAAPTLSETWTLTPPTRTSTPGDAAHGRTEVVRQRRDRQVGHRGQAATRDAPRTLARRRRAPRRPSLALQQHRIIRSGRAKPSISCASARPAPPPGRAALRRRHLSPRRSAGSSTTATTAGSTSSMRRGRTDSDQ